MKTIEEIEKYLRDTKQSFSGRMQYAEEQLAELKKGDAPRGITNPIHGKWYIARCKQPSCDYLIRFDKKERDNFISFEYAFKSETNANIWTTGGNGGSFSEIVRLATPKEIEDHLKKVAEEKGFVEGVHFICLHYPDRGVRKFRGRLEYLPEYDDFRDDTDHGSFSATIYCKGQWAEILPEKKALPKTKDELRKSFYAFQDRDGGNFNDFLKQYED